MIKANRVDDHEFCQIVFVWTIISMPGDNIERRMILLAFKKAALKFRNNFVIFSIAILKIRRWCQEITWMGQTIRSENKFRHVVNYKL